MPAELADKFWDLGNYVSGFAVAQGVAFAILLGTSGPFRSRVRSGWRWTLGFTVVATVLYVAGIVICATWEARMHLSCDQEGWRATFLLRSPQRQLPGRVIREPATPWDAVQRAAWYALRHVEPASGLTRRACRRGSGPAPRRVREHPGDWKQVAEVTDFAAAYPCCSTTPR